MSYPASVITRIVQLGGAVSVESGIPLTVHTVTVASRALIDVETGSRLERVAYEASSALTGDPVQWPVAVTNRSSAFLDAETRELIVLGTDEHTHLYTTTLTILDGTEQVAEYVIGPYPVPAGASVLDLDTSLIPSGTTDGTLVAIPESWELKLADASSDTGWVDIKSYFLAEFTGTLWARKFGRVVEIRGTLTAGNISDATTKTIASAIPAQFRPAPAGNAWGSAYFAGPYLGAAFITSSGALAVTQRSGVAWGNGTQLSLTYLA